MTLDDVTVTWRQIVDVTHPGLNTHLGLNTCKYSAWLRFIFSVDMDLWKLHHLRWRHMTLDDATFNCRCNTYWLEYMQGLSKYEKHLKLIQCQEVWILARKSKFEKEKQRKNLTFRQHRKQRSDDFQMLPKSWSIRCPNLNIIAVLLFNEIQWIEKCNLIHDDVMMM